ncbi:MAG: DNA primase [Planctomycetes bacterium]|nr:DNA primase [Planctomycetota bacterium]
MAILSSFDAKQRVKQATDIVDLVGGHLPLRREGRIFKATCPWHDDTRPSLQINPERQSWKCWVCDVGGDVFDFVMRREGLEFPQALAMLAERAGIELTPTRPGTATTSGSDKQSLYRAMAWAEELFHRCLLDDPAAEPARRYLAERGIAQQSIQRFRIGFSPNQWKWLLEKANGTQFPPALLEQVGLVGTSQGGGRYDRFKGRVLFPIHDERGRSIGTGGRILPEFADERAAKYVNSPTTPLFSKSDNLYGLDLAREPIDRAKHAVVMEGYTDCVMAAQFGFENTLAVLGTALGERHVRLLSRFAERITLVLDGDDAGQKRTNEVLELFMSANVDLRVATPPDGLDPCDLLLTRGSEAFAALLDSAVDAWDHKLQALTRGIDPGSGNHAATAALEEMLEFLSKGPSQAARETTHQLRVNQLLSRLARSFHVPENELREQIVKQRRRRRTGAKLANPGTKMISAVDSWERDLMETLLHEPEAVARAAESIAPGELSDTGCRAIYEKCIALSAAGILSDFDRLILEFEDSELRALLVRLDEGAQRRVDGGVDLAAHLPVLLESFTRRRQLRDEKAATAAIKGRRLDPEEEHEKLLQLFQAKQNRQRTSKPTEG